jgi:hypothetical protein
MLSVTGGVSVRVRVTAFRIEVDAGGADACAVAIDQRRQPVTAEQCVALPQIAVQEALVAARPI